MIGMDAKTGKALGGIAHLRQSVRKILTTRKGTRPMREEFGSDLPALIDAPMTRSTLLSIYAATVAALTLWEPRLKVESVKATSAVPGAVTLSIVGKYLPNGQAVTLDGIVIK